MKHQSLVLLVLLLLSCNSKEAEVDYSPSLNAVSEFYSCPPEHRISEEESGTFHRLTFKQCPAFQRQKELLEFDAANCAYLFHENLPSTASTPIAAYAVTFMGNNAASPLEFSLPQAEVQIAASQLPIFRDVADVLKIQEYHRIYDRFLPEIRSKVDTAVLSHHFDSLNTVLGPVISAQFQGFKFFEMEIQGQPSQLLHLRGVLNRSQGTVNFNVVVDPTLPGRNLAGLSFE